jgi:hypothetical protein
MKPIWGPRVTDANEVELRVPVVCCHITFSCKTLICALGAGFRPAVVENVFLCRDGSVHYGISEFRHDTSKGLKRKRVTSSKDVPTSKTPPWI